MPKVTYVGPYPEVELQDPDTGRRVVAEKGKPVEVSNDLATSLNQQDTWKRTGARKKKPKTKPKTNQAAPAASPDAGTSPAKEEN